MLKNLWYWVKTNKTASGVISFLFIIILVKQLQPRYNSQFVGKSANLMYTGSSGDSAVESMMPVPSAVPPATGVSKRLVSTQSYFSVLVKNVTATITELDKEVQSVGGYFLNTNISRPNQGEDANITMRVPVEKVSEIKNFLRQNSVKVVSENITSDDITDQYVDIQSRIETLNQMKQRVQAILDEAKTVDEMIRIQNQLFELQNQIDSYTGQLKYIESTAKTSLISVNLSTDELALPYAPNKSWRPSLIFKEAVRSLMETLQGAGATIIWIGVYSVILIPLAIVAYLVWKIIRR
jgi:hypothetical protein